MGKRTRILWLLICSVLILGSMYPVFAQEETDAIEISNTEEFLAFAENCRLDSYSLGKTFRLTADIDLHGTGFDGIPIFCGTFDGMHHTVSGLEIRSSGTAKGLFRYVQSGAVVRDLRVEGSVTPDSGNTAGGIVGNNAGILENCSFHGNVGAASLAGGIAGINEAGGLIHGCMAEGTVSAHHFSGGIVGSNEGAIRNCSNLAGVNVTAQDNDIDISDITLGNLTSTGSATATTDIGGIAGFSSGTVLGCTNRGSVGYPHMGYNVGGIVGLQTGYVADCENYGTVSGRKEVGGIAGQQEPAVLVRYDTDTVQILKGQIGALSELIDQAASNTDANAAKIRNLIHKIEKYIASAQKALDYLKSGFTDPKWEDLESYADALQTIRDSMTGIDSSLGKLWDALEHTTEDMEEDLKAIAQQVAIIEGTLNSAEDHLGGQVFDSSDLDTDGDLTSKLENCRNFGPIQADLNVGGIVGAILFENDLDPEEDISVSGDISLNAIGSLRSVVLNCGNSGTVTVKTKRVGGIVGWMTMGLVKNCVHTGALDDPGADYVGGIAGLAEGYIRNCKVKSTVSGKSYVGGIAGSGTIVTDCYAMVQLSGGAQSGAILGIAEQAYQDVEAPVLNNFYLQFGRDFGGIDGISYSGKAQGLSQADFLAQQSDCAIFSQVTITFLADGQIVKSVTQEAGASLDDIPDVPQKPGYDASWAGLQAADLTCILFDLQFHAAYDAHITTIRSDRADGNGRPVLLLQGDFSGAGEAALKPLQNFAAIHSDETLLQGWQFTAEHCVSLQAGRLLLDTNEKADRLKLMVRNRNGNWVEQVFRIDGSYLVFSLSEGDDAIALLQIPGKQMFRPEILIAGGVGALAVLTIVGVCLLVKRKKRK